MIHLIGFDPGFGAIKAATLDASGPPALTVLPSVTGIGELDLGWLSLGKLGRRRSSDRPHTVSWDGVTYLAGDHVERYARAIERMDFHRLSDGPELRALVYTALGQLLEAGEHSAALMVGLPVEVMSDRELARATRRGLRSWLVGHHTFEVDGQSLDLDVERVDVMAQPAGTFFAWGLDDAGRWVRDPADLKAPVAVCDIGFNTADLFSVQGGRVQGRFTGGETLGMRRAAELLVRTLQSRHGVRLSLHQADALLRERHPTLATADGLLDLTAMAQQLAQAAAGSLVAFLENRWGNGRHFQHLLFTGGGAAALHTELLRHYPHGVVLPEPVMANALGLARYAQRVLKA